MGKYSEICKFISRNQSELNLRKTYKENGLIWSTFRYYILNIFIFQLIVVFVLAWCTIPHSVPQPSLGIIKVLPKTDCTSWI